MQSPSHALHNESHHSNNEREKKREGEEDEEGRGMSMREKTRR